MEIGERIKQLRRAKGLTQTELAKIIGLTYIQVGRYEKAKSNPSGDVLHKLANALGTTTDFLMLGNSTDAINNQLLDKELLEQFKEVEKLNSEDKYLVKTFIDAFITKRKVQQLAS